MRISNNILIALLLLSNVGLFAQASLSISSDTIGVSASSDVVEVDAVTHVTNLTTRTVVFRWERIINDIPLGWETAICDKIQCFLPATSTSTVSLDPGDSSILDVKFYPNNKVGIGEVKVIAYVVGDSANTVVGASYTGIITQGVGIQTSPNNDNIKVYPNPVKDYILVKNLPNNQISSIEIYNIFGRKMLSFVNENVDGISSISKFNVDGLSRGIYMIRVYDNNMNVIYTKSISKE